MATYKYDFTGLMDETQTEAPVGKKKAWQIGTPEEFVHKGHSIPMATYLATGQQLTSPLYKYGNMFLGGLPNIALSKMGYEAPEVENPPIGIKIADPVANLMGFARGVPMRIGGAIAGKIPQAVKGATIATKAGIGALKGATQLGIGAGLHTPEDSFENLKSRAIRAASGAAVGAGGGALVGVVQHFTGLLSDKALLQTGETTRAGYKGFKKRLTDWFGKKLAKFQEANPEKTVDMSDELKQFEQGLGDKAKFNALKKSSPRLRKALAKNGKNITLQESQELVNQLESGVSEGQLSGFKVRPSGGEVNQFIGSLRKAMIRAYPQLRYTDKVYGLMKTYTKAVETYMKFGRTVKGIRTMIGNPEMKKALQTILPKETYNTLVQTARAQGISKEGLRALDYLVRYGILYTFMRNVMDRGVGDFSEESGTQE